jgi:hypothetical protein
MKTNNNTNEGETMTKGDKVEFTVPMKSQAGLSMAPYGGTVLTGTVTRINKTTNSVAWSNGKSGYDYRGFRVLINKENGKVSW